MSLLTAFSNARSSLGSLSAQSALVSRNITNADNPSATRKYATLGTGRQGGVQILSVAQSRDQALFRSLVTSNSTVGAVEVTANALDRIRDVIGDVDAFDSPAASLVGLQNALSQLAVTPESPPSAEAAISAAKDMASSLNRASSAVQNMRKDADTQLAQAAAAMTKLLAELETVNKRVTVGTATNADITDFVDRRDQIVSELSGYVGLNVQMRAGNDLVLTTDSGITLFETTGRPIDFTPSPAYSATVSGGAFKIDGVSVFGPLAPMPIKGGSVFGLLQLRDETAITFQGQLDALAFALVDSFAETEQNPAPPPAVPDTNRYAGLFTATGMTTVPGSSAATVGLAGLIKVAAGVDNTVGGDPMRLRDGGISHAGQPDEARFVYNSKGAGGFTSRINDLVAQFSTTRSFDITLGAGGTGTLGDYAAASMGWLESRRAEATADVDYGKVLLAQTRETLSNRTGVNLDEEMTRLLDLERSYQASSKLISTVGQMIDALLAIA
ncbi:flagellar hook-associated protein FlgK [Aurantimonas sp. A3-2-R12]|uniref:flagellar hook-associated protein FlgK n=1 Tax=Aurantimonas sp. A3-2-R12 TaxID=3114362 RepID=UPI002E18C6F5|nr:flagellar hook-associated protein FlgK [Aurantimonas sp. A3-2-R12]